MKPYYLISINIFFKYICNNQLKMKKYFLFLLYFISYNVIAQFEFSGNINNEYADATAYLSIIKDYKNTNQFLAENVLVSVKINENGTFHFSGDFLKEQDCIYKIYIDNCHENISNAKHLLNNCSDYRSINFIANNKDSIFFPLNNLNQMLCDFSYKRKENSYIKQLDSLQDHLLTNLENTINDAQRKQIYKNYFLELKNYSSKLRHPLASLYAFQLYANKNSFSRKYYLNDLKTSDYYTNLQTILVDNKLTVYADDFKTDLLIDHFSIKKEKKTIWIYILIGFLLISVIINYILFKKSKKLSQQNSVINYKNVLTKQELNVFNLMQSKLSNKEIANELFVSLSTVKTHINNIYTKLNISSRKEMEQFF